MSWLSSSVWSSAPAGMALNDSEVHVWRFSLVQPASEMHSCLSLLSRDEKQRAVSFYFQRDRDRFVLAHAALRILLSRYLRREPGQLTFHCNPYGKPALTDDSGRSASHFNMSHSQDLALVALVHNAEIGIDLEYLRPDVAAEPLAEHFFSPQEVATLRSLPAIVQTQAFFNCWTRKEAYIKARGEGLSLPLDQFDVSLIPGDPVALLGARNDPRDVFRWSLWALPVHPQYAAALAVEGYSWRIRYWEERERGMYA